MFENKQNLNFCIEFDKISKIKRRKFAILKVHLKVTIHVHALFYFASSAKLPMLNVP